MINNILTGYVDLYSSMTTETPLIKNRLEFKDTNFHPYKTKHKFESTAYVHADTRVAISVNGLLCWHRWFC